MKLSLLSGVRGSACRTDLGVPSCGKVPCQTPSQEPFCSPRFHLLKPYESLYERCCRCCLHYVDKETKTASVTWARSYRWIARRRWSSVSPCPTPHDGFLRSRNHDSGLFPSEHRGPGT